MISLQEQMEQQFAAWQNAQPEGADTSHDAYVAWLERQ